ncbi:MAG: flippase-like domain-containing protein [Candidatus Latescibacteria bacterium]|nr:flippase-like domain-containing protein [Candidatus Latescibacterota bacterium]
MNPRLLKILKYGLSAGLLAWLIIGTDLQRVMILIADADRGGLALATATYLVSVVITAYRWQLLLVARKIPLSLSRATSLYFIGNFFSNFLPTSIGGDAVRAFSAAADLGKRDDAFASVFIERFMGLFAIVSMALLGFLLIALELEHTYIIPATVALYILMIAAFPLLFSRMGVDGLKKIYAGVKIFDIGERAARLHEVLYQYGIHRGTLVANFILSVIYQGVIVIMNVFVAQSLGLPIHPMYFVVFVPIIGTISMFPFSINALGVREGGYVILFAQIGRPDSEALALSLLLYGITVLSSLPGGLLFAIKKNRNPAASGPEQVPMGIISKDIS